MKNLILAGIFLICCILVCSNKIFSQQNQWVWKNGDSSINKKGVYGTMGLSAISNKPGARGEASSWKDNTGNFWLFGGIGYGNSNTAGPLNDLWKYNVSTNEWIWAKGPQLPSGNGVYGTKGIPSPQNIPGARQMSSTWTDTNGNLWLFGGSGASFFNDLWKYDIITNQWTWVHGDNTGNMRGVYGMQGTASAFNKPGARTNAMCWTDPTGNLWLFGGNGFAASGNGGRLNDLWKYDVSTNEWTWIKGDSITQSISNYGNKGVAAPANKPGARIGASGWADQSGNLWLFGGLGYASVYGVLNDLWKYNISANEWVWMHGDSTVGHTSVYGNSSVMYEPVRPGAVHNSVAWTNTNGEAWMFGGRGYTSSAFGELNALWKYNSSTNQWILVKGDPQTYIAGDYGTLNVPAPSNKPGAREKAVSWTDNQGNIWMFGGEYYPLNTTATNYQNDLWKFGPVDLLPVQLITFNGKLNNKDILLNWDVENEIGFDHYEIERSGNGTVFTLAGIVQAANKRQYEFTDVNINKSIETVYYRLKLVDTDGKYQYSRIIAIQLRNDEEFVIYPNPANEYTHVRLNKAISGKVSFTIMDATGKLVMKDQFDMQHNEFVITTSKLPAGNYIMELHFSGKITRQRLTIAR